VIFLDQIPKLSGIRIPAVSCLHNLVALVQGLPDTSLATRAVGATVLMFRSKAGPGGDQNGHAYQCRFCCRIPGGRSQETID